MNMAFSACFTKQKPNNLVEKWQLGHHCMTGNTQKMSISKMSIHPLLKVKNPAWAKQIGRRNEHNFEKTFWFGHVEPRDVDQIVVAHK